LPSTAQGGPHRTLTLMLEDTDKLRTGAGSSNLDKVELILSASGERKIGRHQCYEFIPIDSGKVSRPISGDDLRTIYTAIAIT